MSRSAPALLGAVVLFPSLLAATCYAPDGTESDSRFQPCISIEGTPSMCCRLNDTDADICLSSGLCLWESKNAYYRDWCTQKDWDTPFCLSKNLCTGPNDRVSQSTVMTRCEGADTYCCGDDRDCCNGNETFTVAPTLVTLSTESDASSAANVTTATATATMTITGSASAGDKGAASSTKLAIGLGVGLPLGIIAIVAGGAGFWWGKKSAAKNGPWALGQYPNDNKQATPIHELDAGQKRTELPGDTTAFERELM
ncbi:hypothetical protein N7532_002781 [Penicillium argentinense]|uniref:Mid2 domain-containing protein n=1 Tax=Penicillium argentinense TaxID=1131581 RepID=A0A9W9G175_9EURO|nr:uncharacterized protein N7532_002781 [Penicillium argentinense]KAJ5110136.1 hypothetical protein N7532_002781 [Penicillium argentinense]